MYLQKLFDELDVVNLFDKTAIAAMTMSCLECNNCGVNGSNREQVIDALIEGVCMRYQFDIMMLATEYSNDMGDSLSEHLGIEYSKNENLYNKYIWPYIRSHEVIHGVRMTQ